VWRGSAAWIALLGACPPPPDPEAEFACALGAPDLAGETALLQPGDPVELVLGFQGFLFLTLRVEADGPDGHYAVAARVHPNGLDPVDLSLSGALIDGDSSDLVVFLEAAQLETLTDRPAALAVRLEGEAGWCLATAEVLLVDDDPTLHDDGSGP
jgi:hypothetical protein